MEVERMPEFTGFNRQHATVEMKLAEVASKLRKS
jgi:hypothetical protein